ncbi:unnamed protein product [Spirodela intermedia]|uniref:DYW domain-containing protein n=1 Tax=Spirodela intermedia TaxID=51605 RepID=A0A7I8ID02_SPIIN|nr:unnamed protein product [Spirodela intermedia]CAA6655265.1 unnamed protein product [Spirodela intermedia]
MVSDEVVLWSVPYFRALLRSCGRSSAREGRKLHAVLLRNGLLALFHMYAACGSPTTALRAFRCIPAPQRSASDWTALLSCNTRHGLHAEALRLFRTMEMEDRVPGDEVTIVCVLGACARLGDPAAGSAVHLRFIKRGLALVAIVCNAAMDMYVKCGRMGDARQLFGEMAAPTVVSWTVILSGALRWEGLDTAREVFDLMEEKNEVTFTVMAAGSGRRCPDDLLLPHGSGPVSLNHVSLCSLFSACSQAGDLAIGRWLHAYSTKTALTAGAGEGNRRLHSVMVSTALVDMYAKCGSIRTARLLFEKMPQRNIVAWNAMLSGLAMHGLAEDLSSYEITLVTVLSACSRAGLVEEGRRFFRTAAPAAARKVEHYACMVDLLGRAGLLEEAADLVVLGSLLASCGLHGRADLGRRLMEQLGEMDPANTQYHVLLSNTYASSGRQAAAEALREALRQRGVRKVPGMSFIAVHGEVHWFRVGDRSHPRTAEVYAMADEVAVRLRAAGYEPGAAGKVWRIMDGERLAIAFGLISTRPGAPLLVFKNIRICCDCHSAVKLVSRIYGREITVRDRNRFHCFKQGECSCSDYW